MVLLQTRVAKRQADLYEENVEILKRELELWKDEQPVDDAYSATLKAKNAPELSELEEISSAAEDEIHAQPYRVPIGAGWSAESV
jgi:hypothetical protein